MYRSHYCLLQHPHFRLEYGPQGVPATHRVKDSSRIVIDEVSGQLISVIPLALSPSATAIIAAFLLFRLFDIFKPYPIRKLEDLPRGFGVMADDALAGVYAGVLVLVGRLLHVF